MFVQKTYKAWPPNLVVKIDIQNLWYPIFGTRGKYGVNVYGSGDICRRSELSAAGGHRPRVFPKLRWYRWTSTSAALAVYTEGFRENS